MSSDKGKKKVHMQNYLKDWENTFKWLKPSPPGPGFFGCKYCPQVNNRCANDGIAALQKHDITKKHQIADTAAKSTKSVDSIFKTAGNIKERSHELELQTASFIVKHNLPLLIAGDLTDWIRNMDVNADVRKKATCDRTKCTCLITNVLGKYAFENLVDKLRTEKFSLLIDESTDIGMTKHLVLIVRFAETNDVVDEFLGLIEVESVTADVLYNEIIAFFHENRIPYLENMVGFASDGANTMFGEHNSVASRFRRDVPNLFLMKCICHSLALCVSYAVQVLPSEIEDMLSEIYNYFKLSQNRKKALGDLQKLCNVPEHKILKVMKVRWLSLSKAVDRVLEQFNALRLFFEKEAQQKDATAAQRINHCINNRWTKLYLQLLSYILPLICKRNKEFQAEQPKIHFLHKKMTSLFQTIVSCYLKEDYVYNHEPEDIDYVTITKENEANWEPLRKVYLGPIVSAELGNLPASISVRDIDGFRANCRSCLIVLAQQIELRFPFKSPHVKLLKEIGFVDPIVLKTTRDISIVANFFGYDLEAVHQEFIKLKSMFRAELNKEDITTEHFWNLVKNITDVNGQFEFPLILQIVKRIFVLPHSSAACERAFSQININKTKSRNSLSTKTLRGILHSKRFISNRALKDIDFKPLVPLVTKDMY